MCDALCIHVGDGNFFAKNSDRHPDEVQVVEWHPARVAGGALRTQYLTIADADAHAFLGSRPAWLWGVEHGVNEHGVAIGNEKIWTVDRPRDHDPALLGMDLVRLGLERGGTADEAVDVMTSLLERHGQGGSGEPDRDEPYFSSFLVADAGRAYVVETSQRTWAARAVSHGAAISNRVTLGTDWTAASGDVAAGTNFDSYRSPKIPTALADHRLDVTRALVRRGAGVAAADIAVTLRNHGPAGSEHHLPADIGPDWEGFSVCMHRPDAHAQTTASMIVHLRDRRPPRAWACLGNPCTSIYVPCFPPAVPRELAEPDQWRRFARLRELVEADEALLEPARATLGRAERELWDRADALTRTGDPSEFDVFAGTAFSTVDAALHRLGV